MSNSLQPHRLQHARLPCPSPTPRACSNSSPLSWWCHPTISSSVGPFSSWLPFFPASGSFQMNQLFTWGGQSTGVSALTSVLPKNTQGWSPLEWTGWISLREGILFSSEKRWTDTNTNIGNLGNIVLSKRIQSEARALWLHLYKMSEVDKPVDRERNLVATWGWVG